ncbi:5-formyltetrahydrofolate cyclo-ligase [Malassezia equina]|uniref:5-formyltetrahydrofolate cyclo-ligase n=1 Tax=Malassezia equina TaxID=1381935 RepID=A0AAF0IZ90_9BASI|nr:5-formyltetrahydrofolate cyclo-ligase [Malassezia equina]
MAAVRGAKATLRRKVRQALAALPRSEIEAHAPAPGKLLYVPRFSTLGAGADAREAHSFTEMLMLRVYDVHELEQALTVNKWGIAEPALQWLDGTPRENVLDTPYGLDLILLPGLAFDRQGARLGQGKGYYDRPFITS